MKDGDGADGGAMAEMMKGLAGKYYLFFKILFFISNFYLFEFA